MNRSVRYIVLHILLLTTAALRSFDDPHFYRAAYFFDEPRLEKTAMTTMDLTIAGGSTYCGRNCWGEKTELLDIYGLYNMPALGRGIGGINANATNDLDRILYNLSQDTSACNCFGLMKYAGRFKTWEIAFSMTQNIYKGLFFQLHVPFRKLEIACVQRTDLTATTTCVNSTNWSNFLDNFNQIMARYNLCVGPVRKVGTGDTTLLLGWTCNYQDTDLIDYIDFTAKAGVIAPTGGKKSQDIVFDMPLGYNGNLGFMFSADGALGVYDWLSLGAHLSGRVFVADDRCSSCCCACCETDCGNTMYRMRTDKTQCGLIQLAKGCAQLQPGSILSMGLFAKADHVARGLSFLIGYSYDAKGADVLTPYDTNTFNPSVVNSDPKLQEWTMHTGHLALEYDFTKDDMRWGPRIGLFFNGVLGGKRIFNTHMLGGGLGIDIAWKFN